MFITVFTVRGNGYFPIDMLRYDTCFPKTTEAAQRLIHPAAFEEPDELVEVQLGVFHKHKNHHGLTPARWLSFGWEIISSATTEIK